MRTLVSGTGSGSLEMHAATVARIIGVMVRTHTGLDDSATLQTMNATGTSLWEKDKQAEPKTWNIEVFIKVGKIKKCS
jgi:CCR4-NOT transcription complex subunit 1